MHRILVLHGPNLGALGSREPHTYGRASLAQVDQALRVLAKELGCEVESLQSNHEGVLIDALYAATGRCHGVVLNPAGLTHGSVALRDAILAVSLPVVEVHLTNPHARETFRRDSMISGAALGVVEGFGIESYALALRGLVSHLTESTRG